MATVRYIFFVSWNAKDIPHRDRSQGLFRDLPVRYKYIILLPRTTRLALLRFFL